MSFKIETVKWKWDKAVKNPSVYRDDEFVVTDSKEEAIKAIDYLLNKPQGLTYTITVERDGKFYTYYRHSMPCYGGLAKYLDAHGKEYYMNPYFPRDIRVSFPEGNIVFIGVCRPNIKKDLEKPYYQFIFSKESPWVSAFNNKESIIFSDNYLILTDMDTDPTVFYSLLRLAGVACSGYEGISFPNWNPKASILLNKNNNADPRRLAGQRPIIISGGTWKDGFGYTRSHCEHIFQTDLPCKLKDFSQYTGGYPKNPNFNNKYFLDTMKEKFGIDNLKTTDEKLEKTLIKAWDYFKKESKKLGSGFPAEKIDDEGKNK